MKFFQHLSPQQVCFLNCGDFKEAIGQMISMTCSTEQCADKNSFCQAIIEREEVLSTSIGMGVAIPHARLELFDSFFVALGIHKEGLVWPSAIDHLPVKLIFLIGGNPYQQTGYLQLLSNITATIKNFSIYQKILLQETPEQVIQLFSEALTSNGLSDK